MNKKEAARILNLYLDWLDNHDIVFAFDYGTELVKTTMTDTVAEFINQSEELLKGEDK